VLLVAVYLHGLRYPVAFSALRQTTCLICFEEHVSRFNGVFQAISVTS